MEADGALVAPPDFKSGREAETSPVGSIPSRFRQSFPIGSPGNRSEKPADEQEEKPAGSCVRQGDEPALG